MNLFCAKGFHDKCKGISRGNSSDRETFICTCECHGITNFASDIKTNVPLILDSPRVFTSMGEKRRFDMQMAAKQLDENGIILRNKE